MRKLMTTGRGIDTGLIGLLLVAALVWPLFAPEVAHFYGALAGIYALIGLSLVVLVGWTGQVSLGHAAFVGFGCYFGAKMLVHGVPLIAAIALIGLVGAAISLVVGIPSLRLRGIYLTIVTLAFGAACEQYFFTREEIRGSAAVRVPRAPLLGLSTASDRDLYYVIAIVVGVGLVLAWNIRRSDTGRVLFAIRDSEQAAAAMGIRVAPYKIGVFAASAALAAIAGLFFGMLFQATPSADQFSVLQSLFYLAIPVLGGSEALLGALVGGGFLAVGQPLVNLFDLRLYLMTAVALLLVQSSGYDGVTGALRAARRAVRDAVREPVRYGSFVPHVEDGDDLRRPAELRVGASRAVRDRARSGARVQVRVVSGVQPISSAVVSGVQS
ncbi:MAG TPA: branched-chain amino acid ABC transporter permease [Sporichthya sp.]|nr:branched-chain amino acid ABC transporter permease [Sporichthya sp.]